MARSGAWLRSGIRSVRRGGGGDIALAVTLIALSFVPGAALQGVDLAELPKRPLDTWGVVLLVALSLPLVVRRRYPALCLAVVCVAFAAYQLLQYRDAFSSLGLLIALYSAGAHLRRPKFVVMGVAVAEYVVLAVALHAAGSPETTAEYVTFGLALALCWAAGSWMHSRAANAAAERQRAEEAVVAAERARIARELHDVVTHHVTAMVVQADATQLLTERPERVDAGLSAISEAGRRALTDLRYLLGALDGAGPVDREPETHALPELIARFRDAGQPVKLVEHGEPRPAVSAAKAATYRVVQEALTNALKHAPGERTIVHLHHDEDVTEVEVGTDRPTRPGLGKGSGRGLVGLRERVGVVGGELHAGARPDGGFTVRARIPRGIS